MQVCHGKRYNRETLEVFVLRANHSRRFWIAGTINRAVEFFSENQPVILNKIKSFAGCGLRIHQTWGSPLPRYRGGESQRIKLATELSSAIRANHIYYWTSRPPDCVLKTLRVLLGVLDLVLVDKAQHRDGHRAKLDVIKSGRLPHRYGTGRRPWWRRAFVRGYARGFGALWERLSTAAYLKEVLYGKAKVNKTNVARLLDKAKVAYELIPYEVDESDLSAVHVAAQLGEDVERVFKTIVLHGDKTGYFVCVVPGEHEIDLKKSGPCERQ